jgi:GNAT superfamily N-acetyltransferase
MNTDFTIEYLADHPEHTETCAAWDFGRWGSQNPLRTFNYVAGFYASSAQKDQLPLTIIAINKETKLPIGTGALWNKDGDDWPQYTPWIASIFTHHQHRGKGIARAIVIELEKAAKRLGYNEIFLHSGTAAPMYKKLGYTELETIKTKETAAGQRTLFKKTL